MKKMNPILCMFFCTLIFAQDEPKPSPAPTTKIINGITKKQLGIHKYFAWRYPIKFECYINGKKIDSQKTVELPKDQKKVTLAYSYEWYIPWGNKKGKKRAQFLLNDKAPHHAIGFSGWKTNNRITLSNAKKVTQEVPFS